MSKIVIFLVVVVALIWLLFANHLVFLWDFNRDKFWITVSIALFIFTCSCFYIWIRVLDNNIDVDMKELEDHDN